ncbi:MAG: thioesterase family protein, partial [Pseudomonadota bacterium]
MSGFEYTGQVLHEWVDYNGHMRDAYYGLSFSYAVDDVMIALGMDSTYRKKTKGTLFVVEDHTRYLRELRLGATFTITSHVLDFDTKRIHLRQEMWAADALRTVYESLQLHVSQAADPARSAPMPDNIMAALKMAKGPHRAHRRQVLPGLTLRRREPCV